MFVMLVDNETGTQGKWTVGYIFLTRSKDINSNCILLEMWKVV